MGLLSNIGHAFLDGLGPVPERTRSSPETETIELAWEALRRRREVVRPWRVAGVNEALSVPAIFGAVSLIAGTMGTLTMDAYLNGVRVVASDRPRLIVRPN